jgi:hypothetical protein
VGIGESYIGVKRLGREPGHSPAFNAEVKAWSYTSTPPYIFVMFLIKHGDKYAVIFTEIKK